MRNFTHGLLTQTSYNLIYDDEVFVKKPSVKFTTCVPSWPMNHGLKLKFIELNNNWGPNIFNTWLGDPARVVLLNAILNTGTVS